MVFDNSWIPSRSPVSLVDVTRAIPILDSSTYSLWKSIDVFSASCILWMSGAVETELHLFAGHDDPRGFSIPKGTQGQYHLLTPMGGWRAIYSALEFIAIQLFAGVVLSPWYMMRYANLRRIILKMVWDFYPPPFYFSFLVPL